MNTDHRDDRQQQLSFFLITLLMDVVGKNPESGSEGKADPAVFFSPQDEARELNEDIFETIYFAACEASCELAAHDGPYETYAGAF